MKVIRLENRKFDSAKRRKKNRKSIFRKLKIKNKDLHSYAMYIMHQVKIPGGVWGPPSKSFGLALSFLTLSPLNF